MSPVAGRLCVFCRRQPVLAPFEPFCSERCRLQDLAKWIDGAYRIPAEPVDTDDSDEAERAHPASGATRAGRGAPASEHEESNDDDNAK